MGLKALLVEATLWETRKSLLRLRALNSLAPVTFSMNAREGQVPMATVSQSYVVSTG